MALKNFFINIRTRKALQHNKSARTSTPYANAIKFGILFTSDSDNKLSAIRDFCQSLMQDGKKVEILEFIPKVKKNNPASGLPSFNIKEISLFGNIANENVGAFIKTNFDYLFAVDEEPHPIILNILARSAAKCRVGLHAINRTPYLDLLIQLNGNTSIPLNEMLNYAKKLS